jgi:hypothetical protein
MQTRKRDEVRDGAGVVAVVIEVCSWGFVLLESLSGRRLYVATDGNGLPQGYVRHE